MRVSSASSVKDQVPCGVRGVILANVARDLLHIVIFGSSDENTQEDHALW